ncbi:hypothetical protein M5W68_14145 [Paenibacillus larvae]|uniref:hypothetical protein n=1 Tax=Paenibacillus larvae TaxID=1464 RepID=UPI002281F6F4|nr:hypothetical protein [Paenibacillus larvae]MCY9511181.1 hypothetical protein [Paenibacillus larvae]MCY9526220.1 hypothetical protein [Paenibacillus larvae]
MNLVFFPKGYFLKNKSVKLVMGITFLLLFISTSFLTFSILDILSDETLSIEKQIATFVLIFFLAIPLYLILNFLSTVLTSIFMYFFDRHFVFRKMYFVILTYNAFILLVNSIVLFCIMKLSLGHYLIIIQLLSFSVSTYFLRLLYHGIVHYAEGSEKGALAVSLLYFVVTGIFTIGGILNG